MIGDLNAAAAKAAAIQLKKNGYEASSISVDIFNYVKKFIKSI